MTLSDRTTAESPLLAGREAFEKHAWQEAFDLLSTIDAQDGLSPEDLERLAEAAMWALHPAECIHAYERAYAAYVESGNPRRASSAAMRLLKELNAQGAVSVVAGWMNRVTRLLKDEPECVEHGYLAFAQSHYFIGTGDLGQALVLGQRAFDLASKFADRDLQALSLDAQGQILVAQGHVDDGMALMSEAAAAAVAGELGMLASATVYCNIVGTCRGLSDYNRAGEWIDAAKRWCERASVSYYPGTCRVHRAEIMRLRGAWPEAEQDARQACQELQTSPVLAREALYELGEIRLRVGDLAGAEEAFRQAHELGRDPQPGLALVRLARGQVDAASSMIKRALAAQDWERLARARLLPAQAEIAIAARDLETARAAIDEMEGIAQTYGTAVIRATALCGRGALQLAEGDHQSALGSLRHSLRLWQEIAAPYEASRTRMLLAATYRADGDEESMRLELEAALSTFERLGAELDARQVRELLNPGSVDGHGAAIPRRATKTFMFTDIVKSTNLVEAIGDSAWEDLLSWHDKTLRSLFAAHGGEEFKHSGDGFSVAFESAQAAVECAMAIQHSLSEHRRNHGFALQVRIGLHTSEATKRGADYGGKGIHQAARIGALAGAEEIIASLETIEAAGSGPIASEPRTVALKGISVPVKVVAIDWR